MLKGVLRKRTRLVDLPIDKIKVGDRVKVRKDLKRAKTGIPESDLEKVLGRYVTITEVSDTPNKKGQFECRIKEDGWFWSDSWFEEYRYKEV